MKAIAAAMLTVATVLGSFPAFADAEYHKCVDAAGATNAAWSECGAEWIERADAELNATWKDLRAILAGDTAQALLDEQRAWNAYKEKSCLFWASGEFGREGLAIKYPACRAEVIEARTSELKFLLERMQPR